MAARGNHGGAAMGAEELGELIARLVAKAHTEGGAGARASLDAQNSVIVTLRQTIESREAKIKALEQTMTDMLKDYGDLVKANTRLAVIASKEKIAIAQLEAESNWKKDVLDLVSPAARPALTALLVKIGLDTTVGDKKLLTGDGTKDGDGRAALWAVVMFLVGRTDIIDAIVDGVGNETWQKAILYLKAQKAAAAQDETKPNNGASAN